MTSPKIIKTPDLSRRGFLRRVGVTALVTTAPGLLVPSKDLVLGVGPFISEAAHQFENNQWDLIVNHYYQMIQSGIMVDPDRPREMLGFPSPAIRRFMTQGLTRAH